VAQAFQFVKPGGLRARFVRTPDADKLIYYDAKRSEARMPMKLAVADLDRDQSPEVVVAPRVWPPFFRRLQDEDPAFAVLRGDGREIFQYEPSVNVQTLRLFDVDGSGRLRIVMATIDAKIRIFEPNGELLRELDLFEMHREFNRTEGRPNTRHPAGNYTMPYALGLWRPGPDGWRKLIVARYHSFSFIDGAGQFEGVLMTGSYVQPGLLPQGIDFNGDGVEEQLCASRGVLYHLDGDATPTVRDPGGSCFYPQVYQVQRIAAPKGDQRINGGPVLAFEALPWGKKPRFVLVVRDDYLGIYDGVAKRWAFTWAPITSLRAAAIVEAGSDTLRILTNTEDGLLWELTWHGKLEKLAGFQAQPFPDTINTISANPKLAALAVIAGDRGVYRWRSMDGIELAADGAYQDAKLIGNARALAALDKDGRVVRLDEKAAD